MLNTAEHYLSYVYEPSERELITEWLFNEHECAGEFSILILDKEAARPEHKFVELLACSDCICAVSNLFEIIPSQRLAQAA